MNDWPYYRHYPSNWLGGVIALSAEHRGVYDTLLNLMYDRWQPVRHDPKELARICGVSSVRRFNALFVRLVELGKVTLDGGLISNARFEKERARRAKDGEGSGEKSAKLRKSSGKVLQKNGPQNEPTLFENNGLGQETDPHTRVQSPDAKDQKERYTRPSGQHRIPEDWYPSEDGYTYAADHGYDRPAAEAMFRKFTDHHRAKGTRWANWDLVWQNWVRNQVEFDAERRGRQGSHGGNVTMLDIALGRHRRARNGGSTL